MGYTDKEKQREYQRNWKANRRAEYLKDKSCVRCGSTKDLEVDHIDPSQKVSHNVWSWTEAKRNAELAKCQILCNKCHNDKTQKHREDNMVHGLSMYRNRNCRCDICKAAKSEDNAKRYI